MKLRNIFFFSSMVLLLNSCTFLFGTTEDETVEEIFEQGAIDPELNPDKVGYVPILPYWDGFSNPVDVFVGYDEMVYVVDDNGLNVLDQTGTIQNTIAIPGATDVTQDRRLHTYVAGRVNIEVNGAMRNLAAIYHLRNTASAGAVVIVDTIIHPFDEDSRKNTAFRGAEDEAVQFTGIATLADNTLYIARTGPRNDPTAIARPDNAVLFYDPSGNNIGYANGLNAISSSLKSVLQLSSIATFAAPPQAINGVSNSRDFIVTQTDPSAQYKVLWIKRFEDPVEGIDYRENAALILQDKDAADRFLYEPFRFQNPADVYIAPDATGYIFVVDSALDSLFQFTRKGFEGVNPPPTAADRRQIIASFGGTGSGPFEFRFPSGVAYFRRVVYVADKGNNRISRFKLSTDLE